MHAKGSDIHKVFSTNHKWYAIVSVKYDTKTANPNDSLYIVSTAKHFEYSTSNK